VGVGAALSAPEGLRLVDRTDDPARYFALLPADWQEGIVPHWAAYRGAARVYTLEAGATLLGGGIVFDRMAPDTLAYEETARVWFERGYRYVGFLWIDETQRGRGLGSRWLELLRERFPGQGFWLSVEDEGLVPFYEHNGFRRAGAVRGDDGEEWILST
jgi:GNAT superfamily N-acetyltransferase